MKVFIIKELINKELHTFLINKLIENGIEVVEVENLNEVKDQNIKTIKLSELVQDNDALSIQKIKKNLEEITRNTKEKYITKDFGLNKNVQSYPIKKLNKRAIYKKL